MFGLTDAETDKIKLVLQNNNIETAIIFGSRAKGNYNRGSDIDITVNSNAIRVSDALNNETNLPYFFDVLNMNDIKNKNLKEHIDRVGIKII
ncbi:MAG: nucleotidyltransferase domain-containing protein [Gammaproteobacteria bacterium]|nr:MAG: nucleotidyltransferase domain-containing protein [Gammaproteobacteria bacterium]